MMPNLDYNYNTAYDNLDKQDTHLKDVIKEIDELANGKAERKDRIDVNVLVDKTLDSSLKTYLEDNGEIAFILLAKINSLDSSTIDPDALPSVRKLLIALTECYGNYQKNLANDFKGRFNTLKNNYLVEAQNLTKIVDDFLSSGDVIAAKNAIGKVKDSVSKAQTDFQWMKDNIGKIEQPVAITVLDGIGGRDNLIGQSQGYLEKMNQLVNAAEQKVTAAAESPRPQDNEVSDNNEPDLEEILNKGGNINEELVNKINGLAGEGCDFLKLNGDKLSYNLQKLNAFLNSFDENKLKDYRKIGSNRRPADINKWRAINIAVQIIFKKMDGDNNRNPVNGVWKSGDSWLFNRIQLYQKESEIRSTGRLDWKTFETLPFDFNIYGSPIVN